MVAPSVPLFKDFAQRWMKEYVVANGHSEATRGSREKALRTHLLPLLGDLPLNEIGPEHYQTLRTERANLQISTLNRVLGQLTTMLNVAVAWKLIQPIPRIKRLKEADKDMPHLSPEQGEQLVETAKAFGDKYYIAALLGVDAGLRSAEIRGLRWSDVRSRTTRSSSPTGSSTARMVPRRGRSAGTSR